MDVTVHQSANISRFLGRTMKVNRKTVTEVGKLIGYSQPLISKMKSGDAALQFDAINSLFKALPEQSEFLRIDIANQITGFTPPVANGDRLAETPLAIASRMRREIDEVEEALKATDDEFESKPEFVHDTRDIVDLDKKLFNVMLLAQTLVALTGNHFGIDIQKMAKDSEQVWKAERLVK